MSARKGKGVPTLPDGLQPGSVMVATGPDTYEGPDVRAERVSGGWSVQVRTRDVLETLDNGRTSGLREYHPTGSWTPVGVLASLRAADTALQLLKEGTRFVRLAHTTGDGPMPTRLVEWPEAHALMVDYGLVEAPDADTPTIGAP